MCPQYLTEHLEYHRLSIKGYEMHYSSVDLHLYCGVVVLR